MSQLDALPRKLELLEPVSARLIAVGHECGEGEAPGCRAFACQQGNGALLAYYFGKGRREVLVRSGPNEGMTAHLSTRWSGGHREWILDW
jgi:hypothetical protein